MLAIELWRRDFIQRLDSMDITRAFELIESRHWIIPIGAWNDRLSWAFPCQFLADEMQQLSSSCQVIRYHFE